MILNPYSDSSTQSQKSSDFFDIDRCWPIIDVGYLGIIWLPSLTSAFLTNDDHFWSGYLELG
jgi:hypothetical protein